MAQEGVALVADDFDQGALREAAGGVAASGDRGWCEIKEKKRD